MLESLANISVLHQASLIATQDRMSDQREESLREQEVDDRAEVTRSDHRIFGLIKISYNIHFLNNNYD